MSIQGINNVPRMDHSLDGDFRCIDVRVGYKYMYLDLDLDLGTDFHVLVLRPKVLEKYQVHSSTVQTST